MSAPVSSTDGLLKGITALHQSGKLDEAEKGYRLALKFDPKNADALALLGSLLCDKKEFDTAIDYISQAIALDSNSGLFYFYLGNAYQKSGRFAWAEEAFQNAVRLMPDWVEAHYNLGNAQREQKKYALAKESYLKALAIDSTHALTHNNLAHIYSALLDYKSAKQQLELGLKLHPEHSEMLFSLYDIAIEHNDQPTMFDAAQRSAQQILGLKNDEIIDYLSDAYSINTKDERIRNCIFSLGTSYLLKGDNAKASYILRTLFTLEPDLADVSVTLGSLALNQCKFDDADDYYSQTFMLNPSELSAPWNRSMNLLVAGQLHEGFRRYRWRWAAMEKFKAMRMNGEVWDGSNPAGKTILVQEEQGFGDTIHMLRYVPILRARGAKVYAYVRPVLYALLENWDGADKVVSWNVADKSVPPEVDAVCGTMDLPGMLGTGLNNIPGTVPYLPNPKKGDAKFKLHGNGIKVGLVWAGNPMHKRDHERSIPFDMWDDILGTKGVTFYSLQYQPKEGDAQRMQKFGVLDIAPNIKNLADTAATLAELDLLITIDSAPAHLAGALGLPVWTLITKNPDWRWLLNRSDSPWYPTMRLFRQEIAGDWAHVLVQVKAALADFIGKNSSK